MTPFRPPPLAKPDGAPIDAHTRPDDAARRLLVGESLRVRDAYGTGLAVLDALTAALEPPPETAGFAAKQRYREAYREHAFRLHAPIEAGEVALRGAPPVGFLPELYPREHAFWLPFPEVTHLAHAWRLYEDGVHLAVLGHRLHPYYGTYLPRRTAHLELFATWLSGWKGPRRTAIDVGTGSGVLALMLAKAGVAHVIATDVNPNACESVRREIARRPTPPPIEVRDGDLLGEGHEATVDLVVFNPPWTPGPTDTPLDRALHYDESLFARFFDQAHARVSAEGRVVLVFSNMVELVRPDAPHPIEAELARGRFELVQRMVRRIKPAPEEGRAPRRTKERVQIWELARREA